MDLTEDIILKLAALGWNGKDDPLDFMKAKYNVTTRIVKMKGRFDWALEIFWGIGIIKLNFHARELPKVSEQIIIESILKLFYTENGVVVCPRMDWQDTWSREWT